MNNVKILSPHSLTIKEGTTSKVFSFQLIQDCNPQDLFFATVKVIIADAKSVLVMKQVDIIDEKNGIIEFKLTDDDILTIGTLDMEFQVNFLSGEREIFPQKRYLKLKVMEKLEGRPSSNVTLSQYELLVKYVEDKLSGFTGSGDGGSEFVKRYVDSKISELDESKANIDYVDEMAETLNETKADISHTHDIEDITDLQNVYATKTELNNKADKSHTHANYTTEAKVNELIANAQLSGGSDGTVDLSYLATKEDLKNKADKTHTHSEYLTSHQDISHLATKEELNNIDVSDQLAGKADKSHTHDDKANNIFVAGMKTVNALGGISANTDLNGLTIQEVLTKLLYPYVKPTISASITYSPTGGVYEFGQTVKVTKISATVTKKSEAIANVKHYVNGSAVNTVTEGVSGGGTFAYTFPIAIDIKNSIANSYFKVTATDSTNTTVTANTTALNFYYPYYYGVVNDGVTITQDVVKGLTKDVKAKGEKAYTYTTNNQRMLIAYPKSYGELTSILDPNGFEQLGTFTKTELNITGLDGTAQAYYVYVNGASTNTNFKMTYKQ